MPVYSGTFGEGLGPLDPPVISCMHYLYLDIDLQKASFGYSKPGGVDFEV